MSDVGVSVQLVVQPDKPLVEHLGGHEPQVDIGQVLQEALLSALAEHLRERHQA